MIINNIDNIIKDFNTRTEFKNGTEFLVIPIVALVEGVHIGSAGAGFYPAAEISRTAQNWNGVPLTIDHPKGINGNPITAQNPTALEKYSVGTFENVHYEVGKLKGEGWIDKNRIKLVSQKTLNIILAGSKLEVSTGLFTDGDGKSGTWNGEQFKETLSDFIPDHLALLPDAEGACNFDAGCGVRHNKKNGCGKCLVKKEVTNDMDVGALKLQLNEKGYWINELSHSKLREQLFQLVSDMNKEGTFHFLRDVFDKSFIFEEVTENSSKLFRIGFKTDNEDQVSIKGTAVEVREKIEFIPINNLKGDLLMNRKEQIDALITNEKLSFVEDDRQMLTDMPQENFDRLFKMNECGCQKDGEELLKANETIATLQTNNKELEDKLKTNEEKKKEEENRVPTFNELLEAASEDDRTAWNTMKANEKQKKNNAVEAILSIKENNFSKEALESMPFDTLENILSMAPPVANYAGNGSKVEPIKEVKANERQEDGSGVPDMPVAKWNADGTPNFDHLSA